MAGDGEIRSIEVVTESGDHCTIRVSGLLDTAAVTEITATVTTQKESGGVVVLDLRGVTSVEGDNLQRLAHALRDAGVSLSVPPTTTDLTTIERGRAS